MRPILWGGVDVGGVFLQAPTGREVGLAVVAVLANDLISRHFAHKCPTHSYWKSVMFGAFT